MTILAGVATVVAQMNRSNLDARCTVQEAARTPTSSGGHTETWAAVSAALTDLPCRVSAWGAPTEPDGGGRARKQAEYLVLLDRDAPRADILNTHRLVVESQPGVTPAWGPLTLYVLADDGPHSHEPFPRLLCTTEQQTGQSEA